MGSPRTTACRFGVDSGGRLLGDLGVPESTNLGRRRVRSGFPRSGFLLLDDGGGMPYGFLGGTTTACERRMTGWLRVDAIVSSEFGSRRTTAVGAWWLRRGSGHRGADGEGWTTRPAARPFVKGSQLCVHFIARYLEQYLRPIPFAFSPLIQVPGRGFPMRTTLREHSQTPQLPS